MLDAILNMGASFNRVEGKLLSLPETVNLLLASTDTPEEAVVATHAYLPASRIETGLFVSVFPVSPTISDSLKNLNRNK